MSTKRKILIGLLIIFAVVVMVGGGYALYYAGYRVGSLSVANFGERSHGIFPFHRGFPASNILKRPYGHFGRGNMHGLVGFFPFKIILGIVAIIGITTFIFAAVIYHKKMLKLFHMKLGEHPVDKTPQQ
ncbi:MAG: hypothetical protein KKC53_03305 [Actinobacteria bacterium]|nr:hypothetical protein [Actinomycetota bacterium]